MQTIQMNSEAKQKLEIAIAVLETLGLTIAQVVDLQKASDLVDEAEDWELRDLEEAREQMYEYDTGLLAEEHVETLCRAFVHLVEVTDPEQRGD
jgi:hypothetical protein